MASDVKYGLFKENKEYLRLLKTTPHCCNHQSGTDRIPHSGEPGYKWSVTLSDKCTTIWSDSRRNPPSDSPNIKNYLQFTGVLRKVYMV